MNWERAKLPIAAAIAFLRKSILGGRLVIVIRDDETNDQLIGGEVEHAEVAAFLRRAADRYETPKAFVSTELVDADTGALYVGKGQA